MSVIASQADTTMHVLPFVSIYIYIYAYYNFDDHSVALPVDTLPSTFRQLGGIRSQRSIDSAPALCLFSQISMNRGTYRTLNDLYNAKLRLKTWLDLFSLPHAAPK